MYADEYRRDETNDTPTHYDATQRLVAILLQDLIKRGANGNHEALGWIFNDPMPGYKYRVSFEQLCEFVRLPWDIIQEGIENKNDKIRNAKNIYFSRRQGVRSGDI